MQLIECTYKIKEKIEDFQVEEVLDYRLVQSSSYHLLHIKKTNMSTFDAIQTLAKYLGVKTSQCTYAGVKDKVGITSQYVCVHAPNKKIDSYVQRFVHDTIVLSYVGCIQEPLFTGALQCNKFNITLRGLERSLKAVDCVPNYFGEQRFSKQNIEVGLHLLHKEYKEAALLLDHNKVVEYLQLRPTDYVGALQKLPVKLLKMFVASVQSYWFNQMLSCSLAASKESISCKESFGDLVFSSEHKDIAQEFPLIGFDTEETPQITALLEKHNLTARSFIQRAIPHITLHGATRASFVKVSDMKLGAIKDGVQQVSFTLPKGTYATVVLRAMYCKSFE